MRAVLLTIGDELLIGQIINTNAAWLGEQLSESGIDLARIVTVGDDPGELHLELDRSIRDSDLVILTGGLGPTHDDITRGILAEYFGAELQFNADVFDDISRQFERRSRHMPASNRTQAMVPAGFEVLRNTAGTAPGLWRAFTLDGRERIVVVMPGVPHEMEGLFRREVQPRLRARKDLRIISHRTLRTAGIGESTLQEKIGDLADLLSPSLRLAYLPNSSGVRLRMSAFGRSIKEVDALLRHLDDRLRERIGSYIYGTGEEALEEVVGRMLLARGLMIAVAESCTGGHVSHQITNVSGSSAYMAGGIIAYSNRVKTDLLGVDADLLENEGAVSEAVARLMAEGVRRRLGAHIGISTTGIAGPTGGTPDKPVGSVWIALADEQGTEAVLLHLAKERILNKEMTTTALLNLVRLRISSSK
jgi:nicotinamide-nucleotide amidase